MEMVNRFDVYLLNLDAAVTDHPKNTRPAVVISPDELNKHVGTVMIAPLSSTTALFPTRVPVEFLKADRHVILDQMGTVEKERLVKKIGEIDIAARAGILQLLQEMFAE